MALFVSLGGTSVAAISYAKNAGAVDGKSAVASSASSKKAAGKLVATASRGDRKGQLPGRLVADVPHAKAFQFTPAIGDGAAPVVLKLGVVRDVGTLAVGCVDADPAAGVVAPLANVAFAAGAQPVNTLIQTERSASATSRLNEPFIGVTTPGGTISRNLTREGQFEVDAVNGSLRINVQGTVRRDAVGQCVVYGTVTKLGD